MKRLGCVRTSIAPQLIMTPCPRANLIGAGARHQSGASHFCRTCSQIQNRDWRIYARVSNMARHILCDQAARYVRQACHPSQVSREGAFGDGAPEGRGRARPPWPMKASRQREALADDLLAARIVACGSSESVEIMVTRADPLITQKLTSSHRPVLARTRWQRITRSSSTAAIRTWR